MARWVRALATQVEGWVFKSQPLNFNTKRSALRASVTGPQILGDGHYKRMPRVTVCVAR